MDRTTCLACQILEQGAVAWVLICLWSGYCFNSIPQVNDHFEAVMAAVVVISVLPIVVEYVLARRRQAAAAGP